MIKEFRQAIRAAGLESPAEIITDGQLHLVAKLESVIRHAKEFHDGHFFILSFTTHYNGGFGTPDLDSGAGRDDVWKLDGFESVDELLDHMLTPCCGCIRLTGGHI